MKKTTFLKQIAFLLLFLGTFDAFSQSDFYDVVTDDGSTSGNARAPQGSRRYARSVYLVPAADILAEGMVNGDQINSIVFTYLVAQDIATSGNLIVYLQNTSDVNNTKSTTWATAITGMTTVSNAALNIPNTAGDLLVQFSGGSPFTYTGGGVYVAFDYSNPSGTIATTNSTVACNTGLAGGLLGGQSVTSAPTTLAASNFRPATHFGKPVTCARPVYISADPTAATLSSANLSWTPIGGANVDFQYGLYGFAIGSGITLNNVASPFTLNGLSSSTVYQYYVRTNCGGGNYSAWNGPYSFSTLFTSVTPPYNTSFEQEQLAFVGWKTPNVTAVAGDWYAGIFGAGPLVQDGVVSAASVTPAASAANNWMFSRGVNLTAGSNVVITMYMSNYQSGTTALGNYQVTVGNAQTVGAQSTVLGGETALTGATFVQKTFNYTTPSTGVYYFGVKNQTPANAAGTHAIIVDNFTVTETLSNQDFNTSQIAIYPNPVSNVLNISNLNNFEIKRVSVTDINGRVVKNETGLLTQLNVADLNAGVYFVTIEAAEGKTTKKFIKQ